MCLPLGRPREHAAADITHRWFGFQLIGGPAVLGRGWLLEAPPQVLELAEVGPRGLEHVAEETADPAHVRGYGSHRGRPPPGGPGRSGQGRPTWYPHTTGRTGRGPGLRQPTGCLAR